MTPPDTQAGRRGRLAAPLTRTAATTIQLEADRDAQRAPQMRRPGAVGDRLPNRSAGAGIQLSMPRARDPEIRRFLLSAAFFAACLCGGIVLAAVGLWH
jgi:hypothetical protein